MIKFEKESGKFNFINRTNKVYVFYKKLDIYGFLSVYLITRWFEKHQMQSNLHLIPVLNEDDLYLNRKKHYKELKDSIMIFIDTDFTDLTAIYYAYLAKRIELIDNKESVQLLKDNKIKIPGVNLNAKLTFYHNKNISPLYVTYRALTDDDYPNSFLPLEELHKSIFNPDVSDYNLKLPGLFGNKFSDVDEFILNNKEKVFLFLREQRNIVGVLVEQAMSLAFNSAVGYNIGNTRILELNIPLSISMIPLAILNSEKDVHYAVCYEIIDKEYFYKITTNFSKINLLALYKKYRPHGNKNSIWFKTNKSIDGKFKEVI